MKKKILLVEDDPGLSLTLIDRLEAEDYKVQHTENGNTAVLMNFDKEYDLIILDIMLKGKNGFDVCQDIRSMKIKTPILMLTARGQTDDKVKGFKLGADDYLTKPFAVAELLARIEALLRRTSYDNNAIEYYKFDDVEINFSGFEIKKNNHKIEFSTKEFQLLKYLIYNKGKLITRDELLNDVWGYEESPTTRTIDTHIGWLRQKLEDNPKLPKYIITVHRKGYKFVEKSEE
jgi:two-component system, OmpR family, alkaline phosphatase synthesis response regulator PhoP